MCGCVPYALHVYYVLCMCSVLCACIQALPVEAWATSEPPPPLPVEAWAPIELPPPHPLQVLHVGRNLPVSVSLAAILLKSYPEETAERKKEEEDAVAGRGRGEGMWQVGAGGWVCGR